MVPERPANGETTVARGAVVAPQPTYRPDIQRWALIVGISEYQSAAWNLKYAAADAQALYDHIQTAAGGGFEKDKIRLLLDDQATTRAMTSALRSFLQQPDPDDIILIYFACHGGQASDGKKPFYLYTYDTDPHDIPGTAVPMDEIQRALDLYIQAGRVVIIVDSCHPGAIAGGLSTRDTRDDAGVLNTFLQEVSTAQKSVSILTAAGTNELAREKPELKHGVFTYYLLEGLKGAADGHGRAKDGKVTVGELFKYVQDKVQEETNHRQNPWYSSGADLDLTLAITGGHTAQAQHDLGIHLMEMGWQWDDPPRLETANRLFYDAIELASAAGQTFPAAKVSLGHALFGLGAYEDAVKRLQEAIKRDKARKHPSAWLTLGLAQARQRAFTDAAQSLETFAELAPADAYAAWARDYAGWLRTGAGHKYALLIGINQYTDGHIPGLRGCITDVSLMQKALTARCGFLESNVTPMTDAAATHNAILQALDDLVQKTTPADTVVVHYSGHALTDQDRESYGLAPEEDAYLLVHDTAMSPPSSTSQFLNSVGATALHRRLQAMRAGYKTLVLDTHPLQGFMDRIRSEGDYVLLMASETEMAAETQVVLDGQELAAGLFTATLTGQLAEVDVTTVTCGELLDKTRDAIQKTSRTQDPVVVGERDRRVFNPGDRYAELYEFTQRRIFPSWTPERLRRSYERFTQVTEMPFQPGQRAFGRALLEKGDVAQALQALAAAVEAAPDPEGRLLLGMAQIQDRRYGAAAQTFHSLTAATASSPSESVRSVTNDTNAGSASLPSQGAGGVELTLAQKAAQLAGAAPYALVVGIDKYAGEDVPQVRGAVNDARAVSEALQARCGVPAGNVVLLLDEQATRDAILRELGALVQQAKTAPALFYFAGAGSRTQKDQQTAKEEPTLVSTDGRTRGVGDITLGELAAIAKSGLGNLNVILDVGWTNVEKPQPGTRTAPRTQQHLARNIILRDDPELMQVPPGPEVRVGGVAIYAQSTLATSRPDKAQLEISTKDGSGPYRGVMTQALLDALIPQGTSAAELAGTARSAGGARQGTLTYRQWVERAKEKLAELSPIVVGDRLDEQVLDNIVLREETLRLARQLDLARVYETISLLRLAIEERAKQVDMYPDGRVSLGVALATTQQYDQAIDVLSNAVSVSENQSVREQEFGRNARARESRIEAHYQLGRVLCESGRDYTRAASELQKAADGEPDNPRVQYYLGQAVRAMVEKETLAKAETALRKYLLKGAPLGHEAEVRSFLRARSARESAER